jgi:hypothetical protein
MIQIIRDLIIPLQKFFYENPMKIYPFIFIGADVAWGSYGVMGDASFLWAAGAGCGIAAHSLKIIYGKGGETFIPSASKPQKYIGEPVVSFFLNTAIYTLGLFTKKYWLDVISAIKIIGLPALKNKFISSIKSPHHYPLDAGWLLFISGSLCYTLDALNIFGLREQMGSAAEIGVGLATLFASSLGFTSDRADLAGCAYTIGSWLSIPAAIMTGHLGMMLSVPLYFMGNYMLGKVIPKQQSQYTINQQHESKPT